MDIVNIRKIKLSGWIRTWRAYLVAEEDCGLWLYTPAESVVHCTGRGDSWTETMGLGTEPGFLWLMPRDEWWYAAWWTRPQRHQIAIDACTVPTLVDDMWTWTDLELDIVRNDLDGSVWVEDEDEFVDSIAAGLIADADQRAARAVTDQAVQWLTDHVAPFDDRGWSLYDDWTRRGLPGLSAPTG